MCGWDRAKGRNIQAVETLGKSVVRPSEVRQADLLWFSLVVVGLLVLWPAYHAQLLSVQMMLSPARLAQMLILAAATTFSVAVFWFIARPDHQH
jgi:hypothetical protein